MARLATMTVWNVQHGLAIHIKSPNRKNIVIDLGTGCENSGNESPLTKLLFEDIACMIITHPHLDHINNIDVFDYNRPKILCTPREISRDEILAERNEGSTEYEYYKKYCDVRDELSHKISPENENSLSSPDNYGGLEISIFHAMNCSKSNFNNFSIITVFKLGNVKVVVCGDNESESFDELLKNTKFKAVVENAQVLVVAHHGREKGFHKEFVELVKPKICIISDSEKSDTVADSKYRALTEGLYVVRADGEKKLRKCLTTRKDGNIFVEFGEPDDTKYSVHLGIKLFSRG